MTRTKLPSINFNKANTLNFLILLLLIVTVTLIAYYRLKIQLTIGPFWDTYAFLANALEYAGIGTGYIELDRAPVIPFLTSLLFRMGFVSEVAIYLVDGIIFIFGIIGLYLLFKLRFNPIESFAGSTVFISFPVILAWLEIGYLDIAGVVFSIWAIYTTVLAVKQNPKFFYLAFPLGMIAFLTRFTAGFILFPILLYILIGGNYLRHFKQMLGGIIVSFLIIIPYLIFMYQKIGDPFYLFSRILSVDSGSLSGHTAYSADPLYYLKTLDLFISVQGFLHNWIYYLFIILIIIGIIIYAYNIIKNQKYKINLRIIPITKLKIILLAILISGFIFTFSKISYMNSNFILLLITYITYDLLKDQEKFDLDILFFSWFMTQFIVQSQYGLKVDRYFITMAPALAYFIVLSVHQISVKLKINYRSHNLTTYILPFLLIIVALSSTSVYLNDVMQNKDNYMTDDFHRNELTNADMDAAVQELIKIDPSYRNKKIRSDLWPGFVWKLRMDMDPQPTYNTSDLINHELEKNDIDYYISNTPLNSKSYPKVAEFESITIYRKDSSKIENKTRMLYIGQNWQNYIDQVLGLKAYVIKGKTTELDSYSLDELQKYPYILLYNFKWHNQQKAEDLLIEYVKSGGTVVIDASGNLEGTFYNLDNTEFLNTIITRKSLPPNPDIKDGNQTISFSPFLSDGQTWYGANYESTGDVKIEPLVTANGRTLIGVQKIGKGKIIWIGYNLIWHAFHLENPEEMELIQEKIGL